MRHVSTGSGSDRIERLPKRTLARTASAPPFDSPLVAL